jgi:hypothetical protein
MRKRVVFYITHTHKLEHQRNQPWHGVCYIQSTTQGDQSVTQVGPESPLHHITLNHGDV